MSGVTGAAVQLGRAAFARRAWGDAHTLLSDAEPLDADDLERLAVAAHLVGRDEESERAWERAHVEWVRLGDADRAARCAFWLGFALLLRGEIAQSGGWLARAERLVEQAGLDGAGRGLLLLPACLGRAGRRRPARAPQLADEMADIADRVGDHDLLAFGLLGRGQAALALGRGRPWLQAARRGHGGGHHRRGVADPDRDRLLRGDRGVHGRRRPAPGDRVDRGARALVREPARPRAVPRAVPRAPLAGAAGARRVGGGGGRGRAGPATAVRPAAPRARSRALPAGRAAPAARRVRRGRAGVPGGQRARPGAGAGLRPAAAGPGDGRAGRRGHPAHGRGEPRPAAPTRDARRGGRDPARRRRRRRRRAVGATSSPSRRRGRRPRCCGPSPTTPSGIRAARRRRRRGRAGRAAPGVRGWRELEMPYDAARARVADRARLPRARRPRRGRPRAGGRAGHVRAARRRPDLARVAAR